MGYPFPISRDDIDLIEKYYQATAREDFWAFRQYMRPKMKKGWWQREVARELQSYFDRLQSGEAPILLIQAPPQHGKSWMVVDFIAWVAGQDPDRQTIYSSFSERLGVRANLMLQRMYDSAKYKAVFPRTRISGKNSVRISGQTLRNREILEYVGREGYFRNTTVRGSITGEGLGLGVLDDPIKGREEANSVTIRDKTWEWLTDDFMTRFTEDAGILGIMTRWHVDDPFGRLQEQEPRARVLRYPAIAEVDEKHRKAGEALFPEHKGLEFLLRQKAMRHSSSWEALYQQSPTVAGGEMFLDEWWQYSNVLPRLQYRTIYADTAQKTKTANDYSVFQCWGKSEGGKVILVDMIRGKWEAPDLIERARAFWKKHHAITGKPNGVLRAMKVEDKVSGTGLIQTLARDGIPIEGIPRSIDKVERAKDVLGYIKIGGVILMRDCPHLSDFLAEASGFPNMPHDDTVDPMIDAISDMLGGESQYDLSAMVSF